MSCLEPLYDLGDFARLYAARARVDPHFLAIDIGVHILDVRHSHASRVPHGVTYLVSR